jgi:hypothetical protein
MAYRYSEHSPDRRKIVTEKSHVGLIDENITIQDQKFVATSETFLQLATS